MPLSKILLIADECILHPSGGLGVHVRKIADRLSKKYDVIVLGSNSSKQGGLFTGNKYSITSIKGTDWKYHPGHFRLIQSFNTCNYNLVDFELSQMHINDLVNLENALVFLRNEKIDLVHLHDSSLYNVAHILRAFHKAKLITTCHLSYTDCFGFHADQQSLFKWQKEKQSYTFSDLNLTVSNSYKKRMLELFPYLDPEKIKVIPNGVDFDEVQELKTMEKPDFGWKYNRLIGFVGRMVKNKGVELVLNLAKKFPKDHFIMYASIMPEHESKVRSVAKIKKYIKRHRNLTWFNLVPFNEKKWMSVCDIGLVPSLRIEPWGITAKEWQALGIVPIVSNVDGLPEHCSNENAIMVEPTFKGFYNAIKNYNPSVEQKAAAIACAKRYPWEKTVSAIEYYYEEVLNENHQCN